jgi:hypothetical protein
MDDKCRYCKKGIERKDQIVLIGRYPGLFSRTIFGNLLIFGLGYLGTMYHKDCFYEKIIKGDKKKGGAKSGE